MDSLDEIFDERWTFTQALDRAHGKAAEMLEIEIERELTREDLVGAASRPSKIVEVREIHHHLARTLALTGCNQRETAAITGYSESRISILLDDPTFCELVTFYRDKGTQSFTDVYGQMLTVGIAAVQEIGRRLEDDPSQLKVKELVDVAKLGLDRTGYGPQVKVQTETLVSADEIRRIREEARARTNGVVRAKDHYRPQESGDAIDVTFSSAPDDASAEAGDPVREEGGSSTS